MPARSKVALLPDAVRAELERRLIANGFADYTALAEWLHEQGFEISRSAVHRHGKDFEERVAALKIATDQARIIVAESPDEEGAMNEALQRLVQEKLFGILRDMQVDPARININSLTRSIAELGRASVNQKKFAAETRAQALADAAERAGDAGKLAGLSEDTIAQIRSRIMMGGA